MPILRVPVGKDAILALPWLRAGKDAERRGEDKQGPLRKWWEGGCWYLMEGEELAGS